MAWYDPITSSATSVYNSAASAASSAYHSAAGAASSAYTFVKDAGTAVYNFDFAKEWEKAAGKSAGVSPSSGSGPGGAGSISPGGPVPSGGSPVTSVEQGKDSASLAAAAEQAKQQVPTNLQVADNGVPPHEHQPQPNANAGQSQSRTNGVG